VNSTASTTAPNGVEFWTVRSLLARHKLGSAVVAAVVAIMLAMVLVAVFGAKGGAISDASTCTQWGSANVNQQTAYARLYFREHGPLPNGKTSPASIVAAINTACTWTYSEDVSDTTNVVQAVTGKF
jgi:hypothetical protein